ncbi:MAG: diguanylate cyclase [Sulfurimonas sp.]|nr:diguanylate cyclase [Sulfurimonas sp.]
MSINEKPVILLIDDLTTNLLLLNDLLKDDYEIKVAKNGQKAIEIALSDAQIDLILLDIMMLNLDGYEVCKILKNNEQTKNIPIIFVTAKDSQEDEEYGLNLGAIDYITKPFKKTIVKLRVRNQIELKLKSDALEELSMYDGLTHIPNRRYFDEMFERRYKEALRQQENLVVIMVDIDFFKLYNDNYGHGKGDEALKKVAIALKDTLKRPNDFIARYGGEEFVVLLSGLTQESISVIANELLDAVRDLNIEHLYSKVQNKITISLGIFYKSKDLNIEKNEMLASADGLLYKAKESGRDKFCSNREALVDE